MDREPPQPLEARSVTPRALRDALKASGAGRWLWDVVSDRLVADRAMQRLLGFRADERVTEIERFSLHVAPLSRDVVGRTLNRTWRETKPLAITFGVEIDGAAPRLLRWCGGRLDPARYSPSTLGGCAFPAAAETLALDASPLTDEERAVARLVALGHRTKQVAEMLNLSQARVATCKRNASVKLGIHGGQPEWVQRALLEGWFRQ